MERGGKRLIQGKKIRQRSKECSVALVRGSRWSGRQRADEECSYEVQRSRGSTHLIESLDGALRKP